LRVSLLSKIIELTHQVVQIHRPHQNNNAFQKVVYQSSANKARMIELKIVGMVPLVVVSPGTVVEPLSSFFAGHSPAAHGIHFELLGKVVS